MNEDDKLKKLLEKKDCYILDENKNSIPATIEEWSAFRSKEENKIVKQDMIDNHLVSTVFIGIDSNYAWSKDYDPHKPHIFETMVFTDNGYSDIYIDEYSTYKEAEEGHLKAIQWVKDGCKDEY